MKRPLLILPLAALLLTGCGTANHLLGRVSGIAGGAVNTVRSVTGTLGQ